MRLIEDIFGAVEPRNFAIRLWDDSTWGPAPSLDAVFTILLHHPGSLRRMLLEATEENLARCIRKLSLPSGPRKRGCESLTRIVQEE